MRPADKELKVVVTIFGGRIFGIPQCCSVTHSCMQRPTELCNDQNRRLENLPLSLCLHLHLLVCLPAALYFFSSFTVIPTFFPYASPFSTCRGESLHLVPAASQTLSHTHSQTHTFPHTHTQSTAHPQVLAVILCDYILISSSSLNFFSLQQLFFFWLSSCFSLWFF